MHPFNLSDRELEILGLVAEGLSNAEIGRKLFIEAVTVKTHLSRMGKRMGCGDRAGMVGLAYRTGALSVPPGVGPVPLQPVLLNEINDQLEQMERYLAGAARARAAAVKAARWRPAAGAAGRDYEPPRAA